MYSGLGQSGVSVAPNYSLTQTSMGTPAQTAESPISCELQILINQIGELEGCVSQLQNRLMPVLQPDAPAPNNPSGTSTPQRNSRGVLADNIASAADRIRTTNQQLARIQQLLAV